NRYVEAKVQRLAREIVARGEAVDDAVKGRPGHLLTEQRQRIGLCLAGVNDDREPGLLRRMDMAAKTVLLPGPVALVVIIVKAGLADADHPGMRGPRRELCRVDVGMLVGVVRMDTDAGPDIFVRLCGGEHLVPLIFTRRN